jgi:hypothetical protein
MRKGSDMGLLHRHLKNSFAFAIAVVLLSETSLQAQGVSLDLKNAPLGSALLDVARQSNVEIIFGDDLVRNKTVSLKADGLGLDEAITLLLSNTQLTYNKTSPAQLVLVKRENARFSIVGKVVDADSGVPLPNANIELHETHQGTAANQFGRFLLQNVPAGICTLTISHVGYKTVRRAFLPDTSKSSIAVMLEPVALSGHEVTIRADDNRFFETSARQIGQTSVSPAHLSLLPAVAEEDPMSSLRYLPGIDEHLLTENDLVFDGITIFDPMHAAGFLSVLSQDVIQDIQVYRNNHPLRYSGNVSGITEIVGRSASYNEFRTKVRLSSIAGSLTLEAPIMQKASILMFARKSLNQSPMQELFSRSIYNIPELDGPVTDPAMTFYDLVSKLSVTPTRTDVFSATFLHTVDRTTLFQGQRTVKNTGLSGQWFHQWHKKFSSVTSFAYSNAQFSYGYGLDRRQYEFLAENSLSLSPAHETRFGLNLIHFTEEFYKYDLASAFLHHTWEVRPGFTAGLGIRSLIDTVNDRYYPEPRFSLTWQPTSGLNFKGVLGYSNQFITNASFNEIPAKSNFQMLGANYALSDLELDLQLYRRSEIRDPLSLSDQTGDARGVGLFGKYHKARFTYWLSYQYIDAERLERKAISVTNLLNGYVGGHAIKAVTNFAQSGWNLSVAWGLQTALPYGVRQPVTVESPTGQIWATLDLVGDGSVDYLPTRHSLDLSLNKAVVVGGVTSRLGLSFYNLYDHDNVASIYHLGGFDPRVRETFSRTFFLPDFTVAFNMLVEFN